MDCKDVPSKGGAKLTETISMRSLTVILNPTYVEILEDVRKKIVIVGILSLASSSVGTIRFNFPPL